MTPPSPGFPRTVLDLLFAAGEGGSKASGHQILSASADRIVAAEAGDELRGAWPT